MPSIWKGSLTFGLVNIPIELRSAVRSDHISFRLLHADDRSPVRYERVCQAEDEPVPWSEIVKGYEYQKGKFVVLTDKDFETAALESTSTIDILDFVKQDEIDPRYFETPYYLLPAKGGEKAYALLREAIRESGSVGIGKIILHQKQHLAGVKVVGNALMLELMRFASELVDATEYAFPPTRDVTAPERKMALQLVDSLTDTFDPTKYTDEYRANLMRVITAKMKGKKARLREPAEPKQDAKVIDLMARLQESLAHRGKRSGTGVARRAKNATSGTARRSARVRKAPPRTRRAAHAQRKSA
jgi:DNA end-binding protein Ku